MLRGEDRQRDAETQIAQSYDLVQAAGPRDIGPGSPQPNNEKQDAGAAHPNHRARDLKKRGEKGWVHVDAWRRLACCNCALSAPESPFRGSKRSEVYTDPNRVFLELRRGHPRHLTALRKLRMAQPAMKGCDNLEE